jgi:hypothetical protein
MKKYTLSFRLLIIFCFALIIKSNVINAQLNFPHDTSYYETYPNKLTVRLYLSQKYLHINVPNTGSQQDMEYKANPKLNLGTGVTWHNLSLNVFYGFAFLNNEDSIKGKTKGLDIQFHLFPSKWAVDVLAVFPKGYYLDPKGYAAANANSYYYRPDIKFNLIGLSVYRVPNKEKFSYRAAILQNEWQKKSAGSILYGGQAFYGIIQGDSALVPKMVQNGFQQAGIDNIHFFSIGPGIGYAYTLVLAKHIYVTGSIIGNLDLNFTTEERMNAKEKKVAVSPATVYKAGLGYNSSTWNISANWTGNGLWINGASSSEDYFSPTGNYRLVLSRKIVIKKHGT